MTVFDIEHGLKIFSLMFGCFSKYMIICYWQDFGEGPTVPDFLCPSTQVMIHKIDSTGLVWPV